MRKRVIVMSLGLMALVFSVATGSVHAQENDPEDYQELTYNMLTQGWDVFSADAGPPISEQLKRIGMNVIDKPTDAAAMYPDLYDSPDGPDQPRRFDMYEMNLGFRAFPEHLHDRLWSINDIDWGSNIYNLHDSEMDTLIRLMLDAETEEVRKAAVFAIQVRFVETLPYIPVYLNDDLRAMQDKWEGVIWDQPASSFGSYIAYKNIVSMYANDGDQEFIMAYPSDLSGTNPLHDTDGRSALYHMLVYAPLLAWDKDLSPLPWLATDWKSEVIDGKTVVTYTIRDNAFWHDGTPVTGADVAFTFNYGQEADPSSWYYQKLVDLESAVAKGNTVTVTFTKKNSWAIYDLGLLWMLPQHIWEGIDDGDTRWQDPDNIAAHVGCGPFKFVAREPGASFTLERHATFWEPAQFQTFRMQVLPTSSARVLAISSGDVDAERYSLDVAYAKTMLNTPGVKVTSYPDIWDYVLGFNLETPGLDDYEVRKAVAYAIDRDAIVSRAMLGYGTPIYGVVPEAFFPTWHNPAVEKFTTGDQTEDLAMANAILDAAGYIDVDDDGIREFPRAEPPTKTEPTTITSVSPTKTEPTTITSVVTSIVTTPVTTVTTSIATTTVVAEFSFAAVGIIASGTIAALLALKQKKRK